MDVSGVPRPTVGSRAHAPEEDRDSMIEHVPLHRDILRAWEEHGADSDPMDTDR